MAEINEAKLDKLVKAGKTQPECARELGVTPGQLNMLTFGKALVRTGKLSKAPATEASAKKLRKEGLRFEFISAATGLSVAKVKEITGDIAGPARGRKAGTSGSKKSGTSSSKAGGASKRGSASSKRKTAAAPRRARTRAERAARSGNPS